MSDTLFFSLCVLISVVMVIVAVLPGIGRLPEGAFSGDGTTTGYGRLAIEGRDLNRIRAGGPADIELVQTADPWIVRVGHEAGALGRDFDAGAYFPLGPDFEVQYGGREISIAITLKPSSDWGARAVEVMYATGLQADSGWQRFDLMPAMHDYSFSFTPPPFNGVNGLDYLAIRPVVEAKRGYVDIAKIEFSRP